MTARLLLQNMSKVFSSFEVQKIFLNSFQSIHIIETNLLSECAEARNKHAMKLAKYTSYEYENM